MIDKETAELLKMRVRLNSATTKVVIELIKDLAPVIGFGEANRLLGILDEATKGGTE